MLIIKVFPLISNSLNFKEKRKLLLNNFMTELNCFNTQGTSLEAVIVQMKSNAAAEKSCLFFLYTSPYKVPI